MDRAPEEQEPVVGAEDMNVADAAVLWVPGQGDARDEGEVPAAFCEARLRRKPWSAVRSRHRLHTSCARANWRRGRRMRTERVCVACGALAPLQAEGGAAAGYGGCWGAAGSKEGCEGGRGRGWERGWL